MGEKKHLSTELQPKEQDPSEMTQPEIAQQDMAPLPLTPEQTLRGFLNAPTLNQRVSWEPRMRARINARLAGNPDPRYTHALRIAASSLTPEKEEIIAAAVAYELQHIQTTQEGRGYNKTTITRLAVDFAYRELKLHEGSTSEGEILRTIVQRYLNEIPFEELAKYLNETTNGARTKDDKARLVHLACRRQTEDPELAKRILDTAVPKILQARIFLAIDDFPPEAIDYTVEHLERTYPEILESFLEYAVKILTEAKHDRYPASYIKEALAKCPKLAEAYQSYLNKLTAVQERQRGEEAERAAAAASQRQQEEQARRDQLTKEVGERLDYWLENVEKVTVTPDKLIIDRDVISPNELTALSQLKDWPVFLAGSRGQFTSLRNIEQDIAKVLYDQYVDKKKQQALSQLWMKKYEQLEAVLEQLAEERSEAIYKSLVRFLKLESPEAIPEDLDGRIQQLTKNISNGERYIKVYSSSNYESKVFSRVLPLLHAELDRLNTLFQREEEQKRETEQIEKLAELQREYLLETISRQTAYLKELYQLGTGLNLADVESYAENISGTSIGSVGLGMGQRMELRAELAMEVLSSHEGIVLEMGEDLESIKKRRNMVNWVAPHEVAHLANFALGEPTESITEDQPEVGQFIQIFEENNRKLASEMILMQLRESMIDGIGYRMAAEFGTADPTHETKSEKIADLIIGYCETMRVFKTIAEGESENGSDSNARYAIIALRMADRGEQLREDASELQINPIGMEQLDEQIHLLGHLFGNLNNGAHFISDPQKSEFIRLSREYFKQGQNVDFSKTI